MVARNESNNCSGTNLKFILMHTMHQYIKEVHVKESKLPLLHLLPKLLQETITLTCGLMAASTSNDQKIRMSPLFKNVKNFLKFACHGEHGLHGYTKEVKN